MSGDMRLAMKIPVPSTAIRPEFIDRRPEAREKLECHGKLRATARRLSRPLLEKKMARILIVEDEPLIAMMAGEWLEELGHVVVGPAHDLKSALELAEGDLDGAILDVTLGRESSYPAADRLRERGVPFAFSTGHGPEGLDRERQAVLQLQKPFEFERFRTVVEALLGSAPRSSPEG
jgi:CheY-like chemotaxis protein